MSPHFPQAFLVLRALRKRGIIPEGRRGRGGSAVVSPGMAGFALLAMASRTPPLRAPTEALRLGAFRQAGSGTPFAAWLASELATAADNPDYPTCGLYIEADRITPTGPMAPDGVEFWPAQVLTARCGPALISYIVPARLVALVAEAFRPHSASPAVAVAA